MNYLKTFEIPYEWLPGDVILDLYEVQEASEGYGIHARTRPYHEGGFGRVYKVWHRSWKRHMAVKTPKSGLFVTPEQKRAFSKECETWINIGLHPHVATCHYVRDLGGVPRVFSEYADAGTLGEWIASGKLYEGDKKTVLARILDVAIQFAWGLHHAHESGVIHQDVKPLNALMWDDETLKVSDFGIAGGRQTAKDKADSDNHQTIMVTVGSMTPTHCSPEQQAGQRITRRTDIWSWAICILEMFNGGVSWLKGNAADKALDAYLEHKSEDDGIPKMPSILIELLRFCLKIAAEDRPSTLLECARAVVDIRKSHCGNIDQRPEPSIIAESAQSLNNKAISFIDLGRNEEADHSFKLALKKSPNNEKIVYNRNLFRWRIGSIGMNEFLYSFNKILGGYHLGSKNSEFEQGLIFFELGFYKECIKCIEKYTNTNQVAKFVLQEIRNTPDSENFIFNVMESSINIGEAKKIEFAWNEDCVFLLANTLIAINFRHNVFDEILTSDRKLNWIKLLKREGLLLAWEPSSSSLIAWNPDDRTTTEIIKIKGVAVKAIEHILQNQLLVQIATTASFFARPFSRIHRLEINGSKSSLYPFQNQFGYSNLICSSRGGEIIVTSQSYSYEPPSDEKIVVFDFKNNRVITEFDYKEPFANFSAAIDYDSMRMACSIANEAGLQIFDLNDGSVICRVSEDLGEVSLIEGTECENLLLVRSNYTEGGLSYKKICLYDQTSFSIIAVLYRQFDGADFIGAWKISETSGNIVGEISPGELVFLKNIHLKKAPYIYLESNSYSELAKYEIEYQNLIESAQYHIINFDATKALKSLKEARSLPGFDKERVGLKMWHGLSTCLRKIGVRHVELVGSHAEPIDSTENVSYRFTGYGFLHPNGFEAFLISDGAYFTNSKGSLEQGQNSIECMSFSANEETTIVNSITIKQAPRTIIGHIRSNEGVIFYGDVGQRLVIEMNLFNGETREFDRGDNNFAALGKSSIAISPDGFYIAFSGSVKSGDGIFDNISILQVWNRITKKQIQIDEDVQQISEVAFGYYLGVLALFVGSSRGLRVISILGEFDCLTLGNEERISHVSVSTCGNYVAAAKTTIYHAGHLKINIFDLTHGGVLVLSFEINSSIKSMCLTRNGEMLIVLLEKNYVNYYSIVQGKSVYEQRIRGDYFGYTKISNLSENENRFFVSGGTRCDLFEIEWEH